VDRWCMSIIPMVRGIDLTWYFECWQGVGREKASRE
jgi:hypothetical protein